MGLFYFFYRQTARCVFLYIKLYFFKKQRRNKDEKGNEEDGFERLFENGLEVARAVKYGDYDYTKPYVKLGNDGNLYSMDRGEYLEELRTGKDDLLQIYDELVKDGGIEDFLKEEE